MSCAASIDSVGKLKCLQSGGAGEIRDVIRMQTLLNRLSSSTVE